MSEIPERPPASAAIPAGQVSGVTTEFDLIIQRHVESLLQSTKQMIMEVVEEVGRKHGNSLVGEMEKVVRDTAGPLVKTQIDEVVDQLRPIVSASTDMARQQLDNLLKDLEQFLARTVDKVFELHVPEYTRWVGQRSLDYFLGGVLLALAAVLTCVGGLLGLERAGLPSFGAYLVAATVALTAGVALLTLRSPRYPRPPEPPASHGAPPV